MRRFHSSRRTVLSLLALFLLTFGLVSHTDAQGQPPPCTPPPGTADLIVCFGNTPCPAGYIDPVGLAERNVSGNNGNPNATRWLCQQADQTQDSNAPAGNVSSAGTTSAAPAAPAAAPVITTTLGLSTSTTIESFLTDSQGMTLYIRTNDTNGASTCNNACAIVWLPFPPPSGSESLPSGAGGTLATISRADGSPQLTYNGMPLYRYTGDLKPGDVNGQGLDATTAQGVAGIWQVATP